MYFRTSKEKLPVMSLTALRSPKRMEHKEIAAEPVDNAQLEGRT